MDSRQRATTLLVTGIVLLGLNYVALAGYVADEVEAGVAEQVANGYDEESDYDEDWQVSTAERVYFAYSIDNIAEVSGGAAPTFSKMGPFIYEVTTTRDILDFDADAGTITYSEYDTFEWCEDCVWTDDSGVEHDSMSGSTEITNVNILWDTQRLGGLNTGIEYGEIFAKAGFAKNMIANDMQNKAPSMWAADEIQNTIDGASAQLEAAGYDAATAAAMAPIMVMDGAYDSWNASAGGMSPMDPDFSMTAGSILFDAVDPSTGLCIALTCDLGPMLAAGIGEPSPATTPLRAMLYGYNASDSLTDWTVYALAGQKFMANGGGADLTTATDLRERLHAVSGVDIDNPATLGAVLMGVPGAVPANGLLSETDFSGIPLAGVSLFLLGAQSDFLGTSESYGLNGLQMMGLSAYAGGWIGMAGTPTELPLILLGQSGTLNANDWWVQSFGGVEPLTGAYIPIGLNQGEFAGTVSLSAEKVQEILYTSPYALTTSFATVFMYGELSGKTLPLGVTGAPAPDGMEMPWNDAMVSGLYGISESEASALRGWVSNFMYDQVIGLLLNFQYGATPFLTQPIDNWLFGWRDTVVANLQGDATDPDLGWVSLETNATYFSSNSISTGDYDVYVASTGTGAHADDGTIGQRLLSGYTNSNGDGVCDFKLNEGGMQIATADTCEEGDIYGLTSHLPWRAPHKEMSLLGLLSDHVGNTNTEVAGTVGGVASADDSFKVNLAGYAIGETTPGDIVEHRGIEMRSHTISLDPAANQIQAKLLGTGSVIDVTPGALPVYFGSEVEIKVEPITSVAMYGKSVSTFYLQLGETSAETAPVFEIHTFSEISKEDAKTFKCKVLDNMEPGYWTDMGGSGDCALEGTAGLDAFTAVLYAASIAMIVYGGMMMTGAAAAGGSMISASSEEEE